MLVNASSASFGATSITVASHYNEVGCVKIAIAWADSNVSVTTNWVISYVNS